MCKWLFQLRLFLVEALFQPLDLCFSEANQIANANIVLDGRRRICVVLVDGTSARSTIEFFVGMNHDVAMPVLRWGVRRILLLDEIVFLHFMALHYSLFSFAIISQIVVLNKKAVLHKRMGRDRNPAPQQGEKTIDYR